MEIREDGWLSERFGHAVYTLSGLEEGFDATVLRQHAAAREAASYQAKVPVDAEALAGELGAAGFRAVCTAVTLRRGLEPPLPAAGGGGLAVRVLDPARDGALPELAARAFRSSRFHLDPQIPDEVAAAIKRDWAAAYLAGTRGESALVAEGDGGPVGFLGVVAAADVRVIDLIAVDPEVQGRGAGRALVARFLEESRGRCAGVEVGTQVENAAAVRFYEELGFATARTAHDLHLHTGAAWRAR